MAKTKEKTLSGAERTRKYREKLKKDAKHSAGVKEKDRIRKQNERQKNKRQM